MYVCMYVCMYKEEETKRETGTDPCLIKTAAQDNRGLALSRYCECVRSNKTSNTLCRFNVWKPVIV